MIPQKIYKLMPDVIAADMLFTDSDGYKAYKPGSEAVFLRRDGLLLHVEAGGVLFVDSVHSDRRACEAD